MDTVLVNLAAGKIAAEGQGEVQEMIDRGSSSLDESIARDGG
jgi:hypothetical protein